MRYGQDPLQVARVAAAELVRSRGYPKEAELIAAGRDDASAEVRIALALVRILDRPASPPVKRNGRRLVGEEC